MKHLRPLLPVITMMLCVMYGTPTAAENIDPNNDGSQHAYAENVGWINAEPNDDGREGIQVGDGELSGWMWGENIGWISLSCKNTLSCATTDYGVLNDGNGTLSGYAWSENVGWINFAPSTSGVTIDSTTGEFTGYAWSENAGWISFNCANTSSCGNADYKVTTDWACNPSPAAPSEVPALDLDVQGTDAVLSWDLVSGATGSDIVYGGLNCLRSTGGDFTACTLACLDDNRTTTSLLHPGTPAVGGGYWYLVRGQNCGGSGTYDSGQPPQAGLRDVEIAGSGSDCP